jgi:Lectin like domain/PKD domain/Papain family cysteine protease
MSMAPPGNGAFIVKNSWGTTWGDNGYFYLSYYDASIHSLMAVFTAEPASNYAAQYQYDPLGWVGSIGYSNPTCWAANVFTADGSAKPLTAVSFYTNDVNTQYEVYIYINPTSGSPIGGTKHVGPTGTMPMPGYHTVKLASPVPLSAGQKFSVVVKFTNPEYIYPVAYEYAVGGYSMGATASLGQSYISYDKSSWLDLASWESTSNVCIKAFTSALVSVPTVTNGVGVSWITSNSARLNGEITNTGGENPEVRICLGTWDGGSNLLNWEFNANLGKLGNGPFYYDIAPAGLQPETNYYYRCYASNSAGASWASQTVTFKTKSLSSPNTPSIPSGPASGLSATSYSYSTSAIDPDGDQVKYTFDWGDGATSQTGLVDSGTSASLPHAWSAAGTYLVKAMATDSKSAESYWSGALTVIITPPSQ